MNNPYFQNELCTLYFDDCLNVLKRLESNSIDLIFADPPYFLSNNGISCHSGRQVSVNKALWDKSLTIEDKLSFNKKWLTECRRVLKDDGTIWVSGTLHNIYSVGVSLEETGYSIINNITWQKPNPTPNLSCRCFTNSTETILWARKQLTASKKGKHFFNYHLMKKMNDNKQMKDVWNINLPRKEEKVFGKHPTQKPVDLLIRILQASSKKNDLVLDPFCGSSTTGVACQLLERRYIGIDNVKEYLDISVKRLNNK